MRKAAFYTLLIILPLSLRGQDKTDSAGVRKDPGFLLSSLSYTNNNHSARMPNAIRMPALMANVSYYSGFGLRLSGDYFKYLAPITNTYEFEFQVGYEKTFLDKIDVGLSYTNRQFRGDHAYEGIAYRNGLELSGAYHLGGFTAMVDNSYLIGPTKNYFLDMSLSYDLKFDRFMLKNGYLALSPTFTGSFGTNFWLPGTIGHVWGNPMPHHGEMPDGRLGYQNVSLIIPVQYSIGSFTLSAGWFYAIPSEALKKLSWKNQSGFLVSLSYAVIFKK